MKKTFYFLFALCFLSMGVVAQEVVILADFEDGTNQGITTWAGHDYEIVANPDPDEVNDSNYSLYYMGSHGWGAINKWVGAGTIFQPEYSRFKIDVYVPEGHIDAHGNPDGTITFQFIAGGSISGAPNHNIPITMGVEEAWYTIEFYIVDLPAYDYRQISIQYQGLNFYADNLRFIIDEPVINPVWADFEDGTYQGFDETGWGTDCDTQIVDNPDPDDLNPSSMVLHWFDVNPWGGPNRWDPGLFHEDLLAVHVDVYVPETTEGNRLFRIIGQNSPSGAPNFESEWLEVTEDNTWTKLQFDMSGLDNYDYNIFFFITQTDGFYADNFQSITVEVFNIEVTVHPEDGGEVSGAGAYVSDSEVTLEATPNTGYAFENWKEDGNIVSEEAVYTFTATEDRQLDAHFTALDITVIMLADFEDGTLQGFDDTGWGDDPDTHVVDNPLQEGINTSDKVLHWFDVNPWGGTWRWDPGVFSADYTKLLVDLLVPGDAEQGGTNTMFQLRGLSSVSEEDEWHSAWVQLADRDQWVTLEFDLSSMPVHDYQILYLMSSFDEFYADNFRWLIVGEEEPELYTLTLLANPEEAATTIGAGEYEAGESIFIQIIVNDGYQFVNWDKDGEHYTWFMNFSYTMPAADVTMTANLNAVYSLELLVDPEGAGIVTGAGNYAEGASISISAVANPGYTFVNWTDEDDAIVSEVPDFTYTMPALATTFTANFEEAEPVVINEFPWLEDFELPAFPPEGWAVANLDGDETWTRNFAPGGGHSAFHVYGDWQEDTWLITPALELTEGMEYELSFRSYNEYADWYPGAGANSVFVSTESPNPDSGDFEMIWTPASVIEDWEETFIDLSEYAGQTIYIAFRYYAEYTHSWYVDDVLVTETEQEPEFFTVAFNLTDGFGNEVNDAVITFDGIENEAGDYVFQIADEGTYGYSIEAFCYTSEDGEVFVDDDMVINLVLGHIPGDANGDGSVNVLDIIAIANDYIGDTPDVFCPFNADVNGDGMVDILDIIAIVSIFNADKIAPHTGLKSETVDLFLHENGISVYSDGTLTGLQFELSGNDLEHLELNLELSGHEIVYFVENDRLNMMIFSYENAPIPSGSTPVVSFNGITNDMNWVRVIAGNLNAEEVPVNLHNDEISGLDGIAPDTNIKLYPNPARSIVYIDSDTVIRQISLYNINGGLVKSYKPNAPGVELRVNDLTGGTYIVKVFTDSEIITKRLNVVK